MTINVLEQYIELTKKQINSYMKLVFGKEFNKKYCDLFAEKYINVRYLNFYDDNINGTLRKKVIYYLKQTEENMIINNIEDRELIEKMCVFFYYIFYFDNVIFCGDLYKKISKIEKKKKRVLEKNKSNFEETLYNEMKKWIDLKEQFIEKFQSEEFFIKMTNYPDRLNVYRVNLKHNIKFPVIYSEFVINKAFNVGVVNEDRLLVEYYLITTQILKNIIKQNFNKKYIVEFADTLLKKPKKLKSLLNIIDNVAVQDKVCLKIRYEHFLDNKEKIFEIMRDGYKIAIILDNSFEVDFKNIERLKMFEFVILSKKLKHYEKIKENKDILHNMIEV